MTITRLLLEAVTENFTMGNYTSDFVSDYTSDFVSDIEIPYAEEDTSRAVMLKAAGSVMFAAFLFFIQ